MKCPPLPADIQELMKLVREGELFAVQAWIASEKRIIPPKPYKRSPLRTAVTTGFASMVEVLLQAGVDQDEKNELLAQAVADSKFHLVKLLVRYGADIRAIDLYDVLETANPEMGRFFLDAGADVEEGLPFARALCFSKRPMVGLFMRIKETNPGVMHQANMALRYHAHRGNEKWVSILLWMGADPNARVGDPWEESDPDDHKTPFEEAIRGKHEKIVKKMGVKRGRADLKKALEEACSSGSWPLIEQLLDAGADPNPGDEFGPMHRLIFHLWCQLTPSFGYRRDSEIEATLDAIRKFSDRGGRLEDDDVLLRMRREMYKLEPSWSEKIIAAFRDHPVCSADRLIKLISTPKMKEILGTRQIALVESIEERERKLKKASKLSISSGERLSAAR
jgi:hypothetical protein